jgi:uncharacterized PurR-regulated membrane protein YhhQ (DUF165 family)
MLQSTTPLRFLLISFLICALLVPAMTVPARETWSDTVAAGILFYCTIFISENVMARLYGIASDSIKICSYYPL